ncbi:MAG: type III toxin-antitoxin system ToxN/AbiQ family toxin [Prevotella sp.]|nr:type III toxin-antitoxin system ToxN/AbiQ family toxin [Prevotella sp.]
MEIIYIDSTYTDYLRKYDNRISFNENKTYQRPYIGVLLNVQNKKYFAPLTTSGKGKKLIDHPKTENATFLPIYNCKYGGINFNNMLPVVDGTYYSADLKIDNHDDTFTKNKKLVLQKIAQFSRKNKNKIIIKARYLYNLKISGKLYPNYDAITCDFRLLENVADSYKKPHPLKSAVSSQPPK